MSAIFNSTNSQWNLACELDFLYSAGRCRFCRLSQAKTKRGPSAENGNLRSHGSVKRIAGKLEEKKKLPEEGAFYGHVCANS
jgi:hypothetical protein